MVNKVALVFVSLAVGFIAGLCFAVQFFPALMPVPMAMRTAQTEPALKFRSFDVEIGERPSYRRVDAPFPGQHLLKLDVVPDKDVPRVKWNKFPVWGRFEQRALYGWVGDSRWRFALNEKNELVTLATVDEDFKYWGLDIEPYPLTPGVTFSLLLYESSGKLQEPQEGILLQRRGQDLLYAVTKLSELP